MISGAHAIIYSKNAVADREFFRDVLKFPHVDIGDGWLIFALPPTELAVHPARKNGTHELYLMCDDIRATIRRLKQKKVMCSNPSEQDWGTLVMIKLPGGGELGLYQPKHQLAHR
ncbi:MAG: extradiol dioxygenase [Thaumarchaeota archaeon]|nr:extradiol dioxygenase [Nitrososphaerota archaeon]